MKRITNIVLDLDSTLIQTVPEHVAQTLMKRSPRSVNYRVLQVFLPQSQPIYVVLRPYVYYFIEWCLRRYKVGIWSAGTDQYVHSVISQCFGDYEFAFVLSRSHYHASSQQYGTFKDLRYVQTQYGWNPAHTVLIDDLNQGVTEPPPWVFAVKPFDLQTIESSQNLDQELLGVIDWLMKTN
jgi:hypothetical protein